MTASLAGCCLSLVVSSAFFAAQTAPAAGPLPLTGGWRGGPHKTVISIQGDEFYLNGHPTYEGRVWQGHKIQGLLLNSRMVQGIFDDRNPATLKRWAYPDTGRWDAERNTHEFIAAMPE